MSPLPMSPEDLSRAQIRMTAMHAAITFYCCHRGGGSGPGGESLSPGQIQEEFQKLRDQLMQLRNALLDTALDQGAGPI